MQTARPYSDITIFFEEYGHKYTVKKGDKMWVPLSVTKITGVLDKPALMPWAVKLTTEYLFSVLDKGETITQEHILEAKKQYAIVKDKAAESGTKVHNWIEQFVNGQKPKIPTEEAVYNGVKAFLDWADKTDVEFIASEQLVYSKKYDYIGKTDALVKIGDMYCVLDYKTGSGLYNEARYQTAAYQNCLQEMENLGNNGNNLESLQLNGKFGNRIIIRLDKKTGEFTHYELPDYKKDFEVFKGLLKAKKREEELKRVR